MGNRLEGGFEDRAASLRRIETLQSWVSLHDDENARRSPDEPAFNDLSRQELKTEIRYFWYRYQELAEILASVPSPVRQKWELKLRRLWSRFQPFLRSEAFIKP